MNTNGVPMILVAGLLLGLLGLSQGDVVSASVLEDAKSISWQEGDIKTLKTLFLDKASVDTFIKQLTEELKPELRDWGFHPTLCEYELADLNNDGTLELLATLDSSGRFFCNQILLVEKTNSTFRTFSLFASGATVLDLGTRIVDLNQDGYKELLIPRLLAPYDGANPIPVIDDIYEWDGTGFRKANASHKDYYRKLLPRLQSELEAVRKGKKLDVPEHRGLLEKQYEKEIEEVNKILNE